ncbi:DUF4270 family protein [Tenacibaculum aestuariivivum]|uniref:DUF4270 family protein n=1 Tax=Tenacibaculum aestuariivivum TaxID=2006131 RepID=UPI003AB9167D
MIRKISFLGISLLCLATIISCEKDFNDIGTNVVGNTKFETGEILLDIEITPINIESVRADNIAIGSLGEYWLGVYNNKNYEAIKASIISQIGYVSGFKNSASSVTDTVYDLDKVILKIPYPATSTGVSNGITTFKLDSILGNVNEETSLKVYQNETFLNTLNPNDPAKGNTFFSDADYKGDNLLSESNDFTFKPRANTDTIYSYPRINRFATSTTYIDTVKVRVSNKTPAVPFLAIPLDLAKMKALFWDEFEGPYFSSKDAFNNYFRGLKIMTSGTKGSLVPFKLSGSPAASLDFHYTKSIMDGSVVKDTLNKKYSFPLSDIKNSIYNMSQAENDTPTNSFTIQGTAGKMAQINIIDEVKLNELRANNWLVNDASLTFYVNQAIDTDNKIIPQRLFIYQNKKNENGENTPKQLTDAYKESASFGGYLTLSDDKTPEKYAFKITDYIANLLDGTSTDISPLVLKVYNNTTDDATSENVKSYNWNPRGVTLLDGNKTVNGVKRAVLKISYSKQK